MKKQILTYLLLVFAVALYAQEITWVTIEEAVELQKKEPKKIIMDMYTSWCGPCKLMDKKTFQNKDVANYINKNYYAVKFNAEGNDVVSFKGKKFSNPSYKPELARRRNSPHQFANYFRVNAYPTLVYLDENANFITLIPGYLKPQELELYLKMFKKDEHKGMDSQTKFDAYYKTFKPEFKG